MKLYGQYIQPEAFSIRVDHKAAGGERFRRNRLVRPRQPLTHFIDSLPAEAFEDRGGFLVGLKSKGLLFRYNAGPGRLGFLICPSCGFARPMKGVKAKTGQKHEKLRVRAGEDRLCNCDTPLKSIALGHSFNSFCLILRPKGLIRSVESLAFALHRGICGATEVEPSDIGVSWRYLADRSSGSTEIILFDLTPGGSGFCEAGRNAWERVLEEGLKVVETCKCEKACYDCLKSYANQPFHDRLDHVAAVRDLKALMTLKAK